MTWKRSTKERFTLLVILLTFSEFLEACSLFRKAYTYPEYPDLERSPASMGNLSPGELERAMDRGEVIVGMTSREVNAVWGHPQDVEIAGPVEFENQKWTYGSNVLRRQGIRPTRIVYFEKGRVVGWENAGP